MVADTGSQPPRAGATMLADSGSRPPTPPPAPPASAGAPPPPTAPPAGDADANDPRVGTVLSERYRVLKRLGEGGMGTVYLAEHCTINKKLAIKVLSAEFSHKQDLVDRFLQEARAASMIQQENVVEITDFGSTPDGSVYFVMEYLKGEDLSDTVKRVGPLGWARVKPIMLQICGALQSAHDAGIIHRDMKPENCYRVKRSGTDDFIKVLDFGIAKVTSEEGDGGKGLTRTGMIFGTPEYMSPEQAQGAKPDHRVDVYATGVIMYELLTGRVPFTADTFMGILTKHMFEAPDAPSVIAPNADISPDVEAIILKAMQKDRELRFSSMSEMAAAIEAVGTGAAAVAVVSENIARPDDGEMDFSGGIRSTYPPDASVALEGGQKSKTGVIVGGIVGLAAVAGVSIFLMGRSEAEPAPTEAPVAVAAAPTPEPEPEPVPEPVVAAPTPEEVKVPDPGIPRVKYFFKTKGVDAQVLDAVDEGMLGMTNSEDGIEFEKSTDKRKLILRADGYEDLEVEIVPSRDNKRVSKTLKKSRKKKKKKKRSSSTPTPTPTAQPKPSGGLKPKVKKKRRSGTPQDLKDPFGN